MSSYTRDLVYKYDSFTHYITIHVEAISIGRPLLFIVNGMQKIEGATY